MITEMVLTESELVRAVGEFIERNRTIDVTFTAKVRFEVKKINGMAKVSAHIVLAEKEGP